MNQDIIDIYILYVITRVQGVLVSEYSLGDKNVFGTGMLARTGRFSFERGSGLERAMNI